MLPSPMVPIVVGHRGAAALAPENTLAGFRAAAAAGARWVEFDVMLIGDGRPVMFHDDRLERTTDGRGLMAATDLAALDRLDAGAWFGAAFRGERVPTLEQAIAELGRLGLGAIVEIKPTVGRDLATGRAAMATLKRHWPRHLPAPVISSFSVEALALAARARPAWPRALLFRRPPRDWLETARRLGCDAVHANHRYLTRAFAARVCDAGLRLRCFTVNGRRRARTLLAWGVESVITDRPDRLAGLG